MEASNGHSDRRRSRFDALGRLAGLLRSVMDLHVQVVLQEVDAEKRRLITAGMLLGCGLALLMAVLLLAHAAVLVWLVLKLGWSWLKALLVVGAIDLVCSGLLLRSAGSLLKGPYLPRTAAGLRKTTRALIGG